MRFAAARDQWFDGLEQLRFLENGEVHPVGSDAPATRVDVRVVSATNRDLTGMIDRGEFREDLLYRIKVTHLHVPPLRQRREDIRPLIEHTIARTGRHVQVSPEALALLEAYPWPGNVRELQNVMEQLVALAVNDTIAVDDLPPTIVVSGQPGHAYPKKERRRRVSDAIAGTTMVSRSVGVSGSGRGRNTLQPMRPVATALTSATAAA